MDLSQDTLQRATTGPGALNSNINMMASPRNERNSETYFIARSLNVDRYKQRVPFLPINPSIHGQMPGAPVHTKKESNILEPYMSHVPEEKIGGTKVRGDSSKYQTYSEHLKMQAERAAEEKRRKQEMIEAEKLRPVTLIRSQQGHRFIRTVESGDKAMKNELELLQYWRRLNSDVSVEVHTE